MKTSVEMYKTLSEILPLPYPAEVQSLTVCATLTNIVVIDEASDIVWSCVKSDEGYSNYVNKLLSACNLTTIPVVRLTVHVQPDTLATIEIEAHILA
ncbi:hypothetical protein NVP1271B_20 [Vibrio phage 1.271.B._10N.286.54.B4]|nr:hypothetical protein NVP1027O_20 [Vibrio phage 1.027.O._10N.286.54.B8]AUR92346.1 hypothetical protein NVP1171O_19 [Vibrio phage 1.171.O._10N.261.52.F12]AUR94400.1 hypothetical protein NVP1194O_20 [Vibrio phage 1.194.O._10N.286.54.B1]AUR94485.1 hypothetical protein NVP1195O_20 [Vibrio phage 1.195.O._10N.286.54.C8]AUR94573.1 hypothetical protein NVP1196O_20 [Vibrio phage 1.196.O._10N.286.54.E12]AUR95040.1 hypothetical protein NVP1200O_20 [Vibrio phage 1.200.O._10N.286.55.E1]AUR99528.1 hypoth